MSRYKINIMEHQYYINTDRDPAWVKMLQERLSGKTRRQLPSALISAAVWRR